MQHSHTFNESILREYDIRGVVNETLNQNDAYVLGQLLGLKILEKGGKNACVGFDGRNSSPLLCNRLTDGFISVGIDVINIGCVPTPLLYFSSFILKADAGVIVTGSHNPSRYNGFKILLNNRPFFGKDIQNLGVDSKQYSYASKSGKIIFKSINDRYIQRILKDLENSSRELKIIWDPANGSGGKIISDLVKLLPGEHYVINGNIDGSFPNHHPDPTNNDNLKQIINEIKDKKADFGFAFDGDADRLVVIDSNGNALLGDQLLLILSESVLNDHPGGTVVADVKSSQILFDKIESLGGISVMYKTGHSNIKKKMHETGAVLGGEMSGHIFFADKYYGYDDAIYAAIRILSIFSSNSINLGEALSKFPKVFNTPEIRFYCDDKNKFRVISDIGARLLNSGYQIITIDGLRVTTPTGWWLLRASNTEPALVARCEAETLEGLNELIAFLSYELSLNNIKLPVS